jgi:hypothetical protein
MGPVLGGRTRDGLARQGRDRARHRHRAGPDRRRRTRCRYFPRADGPRVDGRSPNEGVTSGSLSVQQSGRAMRHVCAEVRQIFLAAAADRLGVGIDALDISDGTISGPGNVAPATGSWPARFRWIATRRRRDAEIIGAARAGRKFRSAAGHSRQGVRAAALHSRFSAARECCMAACCARKSRRAKLVELNEDRARALPVLSPSCATEISPASSAKPRTAPRPRSALRKGAWSRRNAAR